MVRVQTEPSSGCQFFNKSFHFSVVTNIAIVNRAGIHFTDLSTVKVKSHDVILHL